MPVITEYLLDYSRIRPDEDDPEYEAQCTLAYEGVIEPDAIDTIYGYEPVRDERGVLSYNLIQLDAEGNRLGATIQCCWLADQLASNNEVNVRRAAWQHQGSITGIKLHHRRSG